MRPPTNAVAIVTDGACGLGRELAAELARRGFAVVVVTLSDPDRAEATVDDIVRRGGTALSVRADVTDEIDVERLFGETRAAFGDADVVAHTALRGATVVYRQAAREMRLGGAIVTLGGSESIADDLTAALRDRGITVNGVSPGVAPPGADLAVAGLLALLDQWRAGG
jgi:3-oxoacyl-[acyl-carrier protein] reductase